jgi:hypothetical protein
MAKSGIIPFTTFPLYGDSSASLHKHAKSISWDCVMVCRLGAPLVRFRISDDARKAGGREAARWRDGLRAKGLPVTDGDYANMFHACSIVHGFTVRSMAFPRMESSRDSSLSVQLLAGNVRATGNGP